MQAHAEVLGALQEYFAHLGLLLIVRQLRERAATFVEMVQQARCFYAPIQLDEKARAKHLVAEARPLLAAVRQGVAGLEALELPALEQLFAGVATAAGVDKAKFFHQSVSTSAAPVRL